MESSQDLGNKVVLLSIGQEQQGKPNNYCLGTCRRINEESGRWQILLGGEKFPNGYPASGCLLYAENRGVVRPTFYGLAVIPEKDNSQLDRIEHGMGGAWDSLSGDHEAIKDLINHWGQRLERLIKGSATTTQNMISPPEDGLIPAKEERPADEDEPLWWPVNP